MDANVQKWDVHTLTVSSNAAFYFLCVIFCVEFINTTVNKAFF